MAGTGWAVRLSGPGPGPAGPVPVVQVTVTVVTLPALIVPDAAPTVTVCPAGVVRTVTLYPAPEVSAAGNVNVPLPVIVRVSVPLSCSTSVPVSPVTVPPTV